MSLSPAIVITSLLLCTTHASVFRCTEPSLCTNTTLTCLPNQSCHIICDTTEACSNLQINANTTTDATLICSTPNSCTNSIAMLCGAESECKLQCIGNDSCIHLSFSAITHPIPFISESEPWINLNPFENVSILLIALLMIGCCLTVFLSVTFNCIYHKNMKRRELLIIQKYDKLRQNNIEQIYSKSTLSPTMMTGPSLTPMAMSSTEVSVSPKAITTETPQLSLQNMPSLTENRHVMSAQTEEDLERIVKEMETLNVNSVPFSNKLQINIDTNMGHSTTYSQLPLSMKKQSFEDRVSRDSNAQREESVSVSVSNTHDSCRL